MHVYYELYSYIRINNGDNEFISVIINKVCVPFVILFSNILHTEEMNACKNDASEMNGNQSLRFQNKTK